MRTRRRAGRRPLVLLSQASSLGTEFELESVSVQSTGFQPNCESKAAQDKLETELLTSKTSDKDRRARIDGMLEMGYVYLNDIGKSIHITQTNTSGDKYIVASRHPPSSWMDSTWRGEFEAALDTLRRSTSANAPRIDMPDCRILGVSKGYDGKAAKPHYLAWMEKKGNVDGVRVFLANRSFQRLQGHVVKLLSLHHPAAHAFMKKIADMQPDDCKFPFWVFSCFYVNFWTDMLDMAMASIHRDVLNSAGALCAIIPIGFHAWETDCLLLLHRANLVIPLRPFSVAFIPSSLLEHWNASMAEAERDRFPSAFDVVPMVDADTQGRLRASDEEDRRRYGNTHKRMSVTFYMQAALVPYTLNGFCDQKDMPNGEKASMDWLSCHLYQHQR